MSKNECGYCFFSHLSGRRSRQASAVAFGPIDAIKRDRTVIIIFHSISQIIDSDVIYALKAGRVEQSGDPDEVYRQGGVYKEIVDASARSLNIKKLAQTLDQDKDGRMFG